MERRLGTFLGVFTPTILTILGVIMYLRFGWLVGHLGLQRVILVVIAANTITMITAFSFSAVATNTRVGVGGAYYIISRSLGIEIGGAIGVPLFLSQTFSITLYAYGLAESLRFVWPEVPLQTATFGIIAVVGVLAILGASAALKAQVPLMVLVVGSVAALAFGALTRGQGSVAAAMLPSGDVTFWQGFAVFFPAVTGVMAGLGLSGDLKDPGRSIPLGAIGATLVGFAVYMVIPVLLALGASPGDLRDDAMVWTKIAPYGSWLILPGLWSAILSSAIGSALAAPRTLQALGRDGLAPRILGRTTGSKTEILPGLIVTLVIALAAVLLGNLNAVAAVVSMFFLTVYGTVNLVAAFESLSGDPSWRPRIRIPWPVHFIGGIACVAVMFLISPVAGIVAVVAEIVLWLVLSRRERQAKWGDARRGLYENLIRWSLVKLARRPISARNWRPHILTFVSDPEKELDLARFANWFSQGRGVDTVCRLVVGDLRGPIPDLAEMQNAMQSFFDSEGLVVFPEVDVVRDVVDGIVNVTQANGMAAIASNTVLVGWPSDTAMRVEFLKVLGQLEKLHKSLIIGRIRPRHLYPREGIERVIHVWWGGLQRNSDLMLLLAYLLVRNPSWRRAKVKVMSIASNELTQQQTESYLRKLIPEIRIKAEPHVVIKPKEKSVSEMIHEMSGSAEAVFLGLATPEPGKEEEYADRLDRLAGDMPTVFFVKNASLFIGDLLDIDADEDPT